MSVIEERDRSRELMIAIARQDKRITGGALTGSAAVNSEDQWSDIDLGFGVAAGIDPEAVLHDWTRLLQRELGIVHHFDLRSGPAIFRVFLLSNCIELDIGLWPATHFGPIGKKFRLLFGKRAKTLAPPASPSVDHLIGLGWHHVLHAHAAIKRAKPWEAEYYISALRDHSLEVACLRSDLPASYARGTDKLPRRVTAPYKATLVRSLEPNELLRALKSATNMFLREVAQTKPELAHSLRSSISRFARR